MYFNCLTIYVQITLPHKAISLYNPNTQTFPVMYMRTIDVVLEELVEKSRKNSNGKELLWSIVSSLRGADVDVDDVDGNVSLSTCDEFKQLTTARVRGILGLVNLFLDINQIPLSDEQIVRRTELLNVLDEKTKWSTDHFCNHFKHAMRSLKTLGYDVPDKELDF